MYTYTYLEEMIENTYMKIGIVSPDQLDIKDIAAALKIGVFDTTAKSQAVEVDEKYYIFLNNSLTAEKRVEDFGHELGHIFLHDSDQRQIDLNYRMYQEWKANLFALHCCVPTFMLQQLPNNYLNPYKISDLFGVTVKFAEKRLDMYAQKLLNIGMQVRLAQQQRGA